MELLEQIEAYLVQNDLAPSTFGRRAVGDPRFVMDLRSGRTPREETQQRVQQYLLESSKRRSRSKFSQILASATDSAE